MEAFEFVEGRREDHGVGLLFVFEVAVARRSGNEEDFLSRCGNRRPNNEGKEQKQLRVSHLQDLITPFGTPGGETAAGA
jgi:hypothetical protein